MSNGRGLFFDGIAYTAADMVSYLGNICSDGVMMNADSLKPTSSGGLDVHISGGSAYLQGYCYVLDGKGCDFTIEAGSRTDLIVLELNAINKTLELAVKQNQEEPVEGEVGIAKLKVSDESLEITDIRQASTFKLSLAANAARITYGSYVGTGTCGEENPCTLTLGFAPLCLIIYGYGGASTTTPHSTVVAIKGGTGIESVPNAAQFRFDIRWESDYVSWWGDNANDQANRSGSTYHYVILGV